MAKKKKKSYAEFMKENYGASNDYVDNVQSKFRAKQDEDDDIAPVKTTTKSKDERKWFQKGAYGDLENQFADGYQFGDISKTLLGLHKAARATEVDILEDLGTGIIGMGEKIVDTGAMLGSNIAKSRLQFIADNEIATASLYRAYGKEPIRDESEVLKEYQSIQDEVEKGTTDFVKKDLYNEEKVAKKIITAPYEKKTGTNVEKDSILGEKSDSLVQSAGQLGATAALQAVGVPWWLTTGATTFGAESENALNEGATFDEAMLSSTISAGAEILTEKISGGIKFGGKTLDDVLINPFIERLSNKTVRTLVKLGVDAVGEGGEELLSGVMSALGQKISYADDKEMEELFSSEEAFESFIGGLVLGGGVSGVNAVKSKISGINQTLTNEEKAVFDKVYNERIAEAEQDGKKLTQKEKSKIHDKVMNDLEKGYISTDTIEEVLGGETYNTYKSAVDNETALQKEYDTLNKMKYGDMTGEQIDRRAELKQQLDDLKANSNTADMKTKLGDEVFSLVKDSKLAESYNEKSRRGQAFEVDLSQYEEKYHGTLKKAVESGYLNNTRRTHELVDMISKISADKGVLFDFTNNENLKKSSFAVDGKIVNAYVTKDGITLNIDSPKYLNSVTGHEITHTFEGTEFYEPLKQVAIEYAKIKGEYDSRLEALNKLYNGVEGANVEAELVADLVGDYVFTDSDFVRKLSTENRNIFQKIYDEIKYLCKVATAGSKEARALEKVKKTFAEVYQESGKTESKGKKYSLSADSDGNKLTDGQKEYFKDSKVVDKNGNLKVMYHGSPEAFTKFDKKKAKSSGAYGNGFYFTDSTSHANTYGERYTVYLNITNPVQKGTNDITKEQLRKFVEAVAENEDYGIENYGYGATVDSVTDSVYGKDDFSMLMDINISCVGNMVEAVELFNEVNGTDYNGIIVPTETVAFYPEQIKNIDNQKPTADPDIRYSLSEDSEGTKLTENQQAFFKDSKMRDENGNLRVLYHGSPNKFTTFKQGKADGWGTGIYFTDNQAEAENYGENIVKAHLNITNPYNADTMSYDEIGAENTKAYQEYDKKVWKEQGEYDTYEEYKADGQSVDIADIYSDEVEVFNQILRELGYDGIIADGSNGIDGLEVVAFNENQAKLTTNTEPTSDPDIRYSLSDTDYLKAVESKDTETISRMVEEAAKNSGYTIEAYHGTPNNEFTVFDKERLGKGNDQYGAGFYFASDKTGASHYGNRVINSALSIKNPIRITATGESGRNLIDAEIELTSKQAYEVVKRHPDIYDEENSPLGDYFDSYWEDGAQDWMIRNLAEQYRDVGYLDSDLFRYYPNELHEALRDVVGYDGVEVTFESTGEKFYVAWFDNQMKSVDPVTYDDNGNVIPLSERFNKSENDIRYSLSEQGEKPTKHGDLHISGEDVKLETAKQEVEDDIAPLMDNTPITEEEAIEISRESLETLDDSDAPPEVDEEYYELPDTSSIDNKTLKNIGKELREALTLNPQETKAIQSIVQEYSTSEFPSNEELFDTIKKQFGEKVWKERNNEVADVKRHLRTTKFSVDDIIKGDIADYSKFRKSIGSKIKTSKDGISVDTFYQELTEIYPDFFSEDITNPTDQFLRICDVAEMDIYENQSYTLDDDTIQEAVNIISNEVSGYKEDMNRTAAEDIASETIDDIAPVKAQQVMDGTPYKVNASKEPIKTVEVREAKKLQNLETELANNEQLLRESIVDFDKEIERLSQEYLAKKDKNTQVANNLIRRITRLQRLKANVEADYSKRISDLQTRIDDTKQNVKTERKAEILTEEPTVEKPKNKGWSKFVSNFVDKQSVFETLALKTKNRTLQAKANFMRYSEGRAQNFIGKGTKKVEALNDIRKKVESAGHTQQLYEYLYHKHNADRMTLADRYDDVENKPVFGDYVTAEVSKQEIAKLEKANPKLKEYAESIYNINHYLRNMLVEGGVISQETADLWEEMYPHYVPVRRVGESGLNINVALDTNKTGINAPIKRATGGNSAILPLFNTMAQRVMQTYKAVAKNRFGVELKNTLGTTIEKSTANIDEVIDSIDSHEELLQEGKNGQSPTFTVFENGERVTFEITEEMYDALKPTSKGMAYTNKAAQGTSNFHRALLTDKNPTFMLTNAVKDTQDVLLNSQHPARTYANFPRAIGELLTGKGKYITEYMENGGEQNTYFEEPIKNYDKEIKRLTEKLSKTDKNSQSAKNLVRRIKKLQNKKNYFVEEKSALRKVVGFPLDAISTANNFIERIPRLAEYIASRKSGASVEVAMLDSARVTTNFAAGGDMTKFLNRNGATFLNASVQGAVQQVRNVREAKANGLKGWVGLATKVTLAGLPAMLLNGLLWDDDEEYAELSDYVKDNYYIVGKTSDGKFLRIPKGRASAVIQDAFEQICNTLTGNDEVDFANFFNLVKTNLAPNNPIDNNILAPIVDVAQNKTWYGEDLVPTRLQDLPKAEQFDESTDSISKWLGENLNFSPYKINYLLNQYSGGVGDVVLPMLTPEAESGDNSLSGNLIAPLKDKFTTDSTMNNQNISDFYDTVDELTANAKSSKATDEDILKNKYMNSVNAELGELYGKKREIQNDSTLTDEEKYNQVLDIQEQINTLARNSLDSYKNVSIEGNYATVGDLHYRWYEPSETSEAEAGWQKISGKQLEKQEEVTSGLGISPSQYWENKEEYDYAYEYPEKYAIAKSVGGYETYKSYTSDLYDIKADKDASGKSISGSRKEKVADYINNLDIDYGEKIILFKSQYNADDTYNYDIINYLNSREDISWEDMSIILKGLGFEVDSNGNIWWD